MSADEARVRRVLGAVVRAALRETGAGGLVIAAPPDPQAELLARWIRDWEIELVAPETVEAQLREPRPAEDDVPEADEARLRREERHRMAARLLARRRNVLPVHPIHKTSLVLGGAPPPEPLLPLGDVYASRLSRWCDGVRRPPPLRHRSREEVSAVDRALARHLEGRLPWERASRDLAPELAGTMKDALDRGRWHRLQAPVVPKLGDRTWGIDLDV